MPAHALWRIPGVGYFDTVDTIETFDENRSDVGVKAVPLLESDLSPCTRS